MENDTNLTPEQENGVPENYDDCEAQHYSVPSEKLKVGFISFLKRCGFPDMLLMRFIGAYFLISGINISSALKNEIGAINSWRQFIGTVSVSYTLLFSAAIFILLTALHFLTGGKMKIADAFAAITGVLYFSLSLMWKNEDFYLCMALIAVCVVLISYIIGKTTHRSLEKFPLWVSAAVVIIAAAAVTLFVAVNSAARHFAFRTSCYDFGIFVQMFHSMITDFTAETTCERDKLLSHFFVHSSYIYYLLAPIYAIFPKEETLLTAQAVLAMGGIFPLFLIAKNHNYRGLFLTGICLVYVFFPGIIAPCFYDFHENAFLPTLLMWTLYAMDRKKLPLFYMMSVLVCLVKEDAPLYIICIAIFFFFDERSPKRLHGIIIAFISAAYFAVITSWLTENGDGSIMTVSRFGNLIIDRDGGFIEIIRNVLLNPGYFFSQMLTESTLLFFLKVMAPLLFLPFMTKRIHRFLLIIPFVIMNLVIGAGYKYAADIMYQYIFGPSCLLIYMSLINCEELKSERKHIAAVSAAAASVIAAFCIVSKNASYYQIYTSCRDYYTSIEECLDSVPDDASVIANTWYLPHIADRKEVYNFNTDDFIIDESETAVALREPERYDFYVMSTSDSNTVTAIPLLEDAGFTLYSKTDGAVIYVSPDYKLS